MRLLGLTLLLTGVATASLCACHPVERRGHARWMFAERPYKVGDRLDCPTQVDELTRTAAAGDGRSCRYQGPEAEDVELSLTPLNGQDPKMALAGLQQSLKTQSGAPSASATGAGAESQVSTGNDEGATHARIDLPGLHLDADHGGASIRLPGLSVNANDAGARIHTGWGPYKNLQVQAQGGHAEISGGDVTGAGARLLYLIASDTAGAGGYRTLGYVALGPASGPLVVGVFKTRTEQHGRRGPTSRGLDALMRLNVKD